MLGGNVARLIGRADQAVRRSHRDETAGLGLGQCAPGVLGQQERARQEHRDQPVPLLLGELAHPTHVLEARVRDQHVEPPEALQRGFHGRAVPGARDQVGPEGLSRTARLRIKIDRQDMRAVALEPGSDRSADAAGGPGHERDAALRGPDAARSRSRYGCRAAPGHGVPSSYTGAGSREVSAPSAGRARPRRARPCRASARRAAPPRSGPPGNPRRACPLVAARCSSPRDGGPLADQPADIGC
jgi:hypothetical protein